MRVGGRRAGAGLLPAAPQRRMSLTTRVAPPRYLLGQALHAEWTKFRTVPGPAWLMAGVVTLTVAVGVAAASAARCQAATCGIDPAKVSFTGVYLGLAVVAVAGVLAIGNEYSTGMIKLSLTAVPRRLTWFFAKATVLTGPVLSASALAVAGAALAGRLILPGHGFASAHGYASLISATDLRAAVGAVLYLTLIALLSLRLAAAVRDPGGRRCPPPRRTCLEIPRRMTLIRERASTPAWARQRMRERAARTSFPCIGRRRSLPRRRRRSQCCSSFVRSELAGCDVQAGPVSRSCGSFRPTRPARRRARHRSCHDGPPPRLPYASPSASPALPDLLLFLNGVCLAARH